MANKPKQGSKQASRDRRAKVEELKRAQKAAERRKNMLFAMVATVVAVGLIAAAVVPAVISSRNDPANKEPNQLGPPASAAGCGPIENDEATGEAQHLQPGTRIDYATVPPSSGKHYAIPLPFDRKFYATGDQPPVENLVHNLEHGYLVLWYDDTVGGKQRQTLEDLTKRIPEDRPKFIVAPLDESRGSLPEGKHVAMSVWGHRQLCARTSGQAVAEFSRRFPPSVAPEPNGA